MLHCLRATTAYVLGRRTLNYQHAKLNVALLSSRRPIRSRLSTSTGKTTAPPPSDGGDRLLSSEDFIHPEHEKIAMSKGTMFVFAEESDLKEIPMDDSIKDSGTIPPGYSIDFIVSPERIISVLKKMGITTIGQLPEDTYDEMRATINNPSNLSIIPTSVYEFKRQLQAQTDRESEQENTNSSRTAPSPPPPTSDGGEKPLSIEDFIDPEHVKNALSKGTMFVWVDESDRVEEIPMDDRYKDSGIIPPGYSIDFIVSPGTIVSFLKKMGITTIGQLPEDTYNELRAIFNRPSNLSIIPTSICERKRQLESQTDRELEQESN
ncbi:hypothetical protein EV361DRAFT_1009002 [Lentinula raphanica]|nr:hypothetical protein EV361DRAFT_1009002 [Lentinula raphanica]